MDCEECKYYERFIEYDYSDKERAYDMELCALTKEVAERLERCEDYAPDVDTREKLEADVRSSLGFTTNDVIGWLDRQAAITKRECAEQVEGIVIDELNVQIDELQAKLDQCMESYADAKDSRDKLRAKLDAYDETHMPLPLDAEGVPIRLWDKVQFVDGDYTSAPVEVCAVSNYYAYYGEGKHFYRANMCRHVKPRTIEDVLGDAVGELFNADISTGSTEWDDVIAKYADELRKMGGDA